MPAWRERAHLGCGCAFQPGHDLRRDFQDHQVAPSPIEIGFRITTYILPSFSVARRHLDGWLQLRRLPFCVLARSHSMIWASANQRNLVAISRPNVSCADTLAIYLHSARVVSDRSTITDSVFELPKNAEACGPEALNGLGKACPQRRPLHCGIMSSPIIIGARPRIAKSTT